MSDGSQKFIARNRAPRVQIEYDVELYGAEKKVQLPFVMGVMSDLAGKSHVAQPAVADRKFLEIDVDNFDERMKAMAPRVACAVPNTLTGDGNLEVDLTFESIDDFSPGAIAAKVDALKPLLEARTQLQNLMAYMDGKSGAEALIEGILANPTLQAGLAGAASDDDAHAAALDALRAMTPPDDAPESDEHADTLSALRASEAPEQQADTTGDVLAGLAQQRPDAPPEDAGSSDILSGLAQMTPDAAETDDTAKTAALDALRAAEPAAAGADDTVGDVLSGLADHAVDTPAEDSGAADVLSGLADTAPEAAEPDDTGQSAALDALRASEPETSERSDITGDVLAGLADQPLDTPQEGDGAADVLSGLAEASAVISEDTDEGKPSALDALRGAEPETDEEEDSTGEVLADLATATPETEPSTETGTDILGALSDLEIPPSAPEPDLDGLLGDLAADMPDAAAVSDESAAVLDTLNDLATPESEPEDSSVDALASPADLDVPEAAEAEDTDALLGDFTAAAPDVEDAPDESVAALDTLGNLAAPELGTEPDLDDLLGDLAAPQPEPTTEDESANALASLSDLGLAETAEVEDTDALLGDLAAAAPDTGVVSEEGVAALDSLSDLVEPAPESEPDIDDLLSDLSAPAPSAETDDVSADALSSPTDPDNSDPESELDLDSLLDDLAMPSDPEPPQPEVDAGFQESDAEPDIDDLLGDLSPPAGEEDAGGASAPDGGDLDDLLADLSVEEPALQTESASDTPMETSDGAPDGDGLDDLLADLGAELPPASVESGEAPPEEVATDAGGLDDLLADLGADSAAGSVDDLLSELDGGETATAQADAQTGAGAQMAATGLAFGAMSGIRPDSTRLNRRRFRMAILGDFSGRAACGMLESGDDLAGRRAILLDPDTVEDVISGFATRLVLPLGKDGAGIEVNLKELDDLHPDELYENVALFSELVSLRQQLSSGATAESAARTLRAWGEAHGTPIEPPKVRSAGNAVPADRKLTDFQQLIGDTAATLAQPGPLDDLLARIVGPHIRAVPDADTVAMQKAVEEALSGAMRTLLHHPEFQSVEAQWRSIDLIARSIETDDTLDVVLYDISAEEIAADLAGHEDLSQSALARLLTEEPLDEENGRGGYSALVGLYTFEETPPHAELLARIARVAAHVDAPFFAALASGTLDTPKEDRHSLIAQSWDALCDMPEAGYVGLATPRFLLRRPYGAKTEPCYEFDFEEFTLAEGLRGMLWANPVVLVAILLARSFRQNGQAMQLGSVMSLGDMPYHVVEDRYGDQVALPCTERNLTLESIEAVMARRLMPVVSIKGRDEVRLASFQSLAGEDIRGPWSGVEPLPPSGPPSESVAAVSPVQAAEIDVEADLDSILAGFDDTTAAQTGAGESDVDAELAALLEGL